MDGYQSHRRVFPLGSRNPERLARVRIAIGIWLLVLTAILYASGHAAGWEWLLVLVAAVHFGRAYQLIRIAAQRKPVRATTIH
jgi:hypothetical protein